MIWKIKPDLKTINKIGEGNMIAHLGIVVTEIGDDNIKATMPVDHRTKQPMGLLHGGASVALSESMGSFASFLTLENNQTHQVVGIEINANHLKSVSTGIVTATTSPIKLGKKLQIWNTEIKDEKDNLICVSRLTVMIIKRH